MKHFQSLLLLLLLLTACGTPDSEQQAAITSPATATAPPPTATNLPPTNTPEPTATPVPTNTPTEEPTAAPTETPAPTDTPEPTATPTPTATPEPVALFTREEVEEAERSRYTGELLEDEEIRERRAIICKVSNSPVEHVRPQSGLTEADIVFEHLAEGVTRFSALFHSSVPEDLGPIRSARLIDLDLAQMYDAGLCFSGASIGVSERLETSNFRGRLVRSWYPGYYRKEIDKPFEHTFYADMNGFYEKLTEIEQNTAPDMDGQMAFTSDPPFGVSTEYASIQYRNWNLVEWGWDAEQELWLRTVDGEPFLDANTEEPIGANNVIFLVAFHDVDESVCDWQLEEVDQRTPDCIAGTLFPDLFERGDMVLLRDGNRYNGFWKRDQPGEMLTFHLNNGEPLPLQIGNTWIQMVPTSYRPDAIQFERP